jgi:AbrB family looped-hinge helix DNA binding protein
MAQRSPRLGKLYGTASVNERGQIVIPAEARRELGIECGSKLLVFRSGSMGGRGLIMMTATTVADFVRDAASRLAELERTVLENAEESGEY